jgi:hypothetical protein
MADRLPTMSATVHNYDGKWAAVGAEEGVPAEPVPGAGDVRAD